MIEAEKALQEKLDSLPDPTAGSTLDLSKITPEERSSVQDVLDSFNSPFTVSQKRRRDAMLSEKLKDVASGYAAGAYKFDYSETSDLSK